MTDSVCLPLITVVTPSYNQGRFIEETILSVLNQDYPRIEYLVIDGGSTDNTLEILRRYEDRLSWVSETDRGQSHAINKGFRKAQGEILCWLNSDDTFEPGALRQVVNYFQLNPQVMMVYGEGNLIDEQGNFLSRFPYTCVFDLWALIYISDFILQPAAFFRAETLSKIGYVDENLHWCMDWDLWIRIGKHYRVDYLPYYLANARIYGSTKTSQGSFKRIREIIAMLHCHCSKIILPAYIIYSFGTLSTIIQAKSAMWYRFIRWILQPVRVLLWTFASNAQGVYKDGWLGRRANFMFAEGLTANVMRFVLDMPEDNRLVPNMVTILVNGKSLPPSVINSAGHHELLVPYDSAHKLPTSLTLIFERTLPRDTLFRQLACRIRRFEVTMDESAR